jgi:hypothetical protein
VFEKREEVINPPAQVNLIDDDYRIVFELSMFAINIKREIYGIIKSHNIIRLMFDFRFENLHLIYIFSGYEGVNIVEEYDI